MRTQVDIRSNPLLLSNLAALRQHMVLHPSDDEEIERVRFCVEQGANTALEIERALGPAGPTKESISTALGVLYRRKQVFINFAVCNYGQSARISYVD